MKKLGLILFIVSFVNLNIFCKDLSNYFDMAKRAYQDADYYDSLELLSYIETEIQKEDWLDLQIKTISLEKFSKFYQEYFKERYLYKIENIYLDTSKILKYEDGSATDTRSLYLIEVSDDSIKLNIDSKKKNRFVFLIDFHLLEKYVDASEKNRTVLSNISFSDIGCLKKSAGFSSDVYYFAEIKSIELNLNGTLKVLE